MRPRTLVAADPRLPRAAPAGHRGRRGGRGHRRDQRGGGAGRARRRGHAAGGRARPSAAGSGAWPHTLPDGTEQVVEHGFHAFFRHYYTWRDVLRRIDPQLSFLRPVGGYPVLSRTWPPEDLTGLPAAPPLNLLALFARSPSLGLRDLLGSDTDLASQLLAYDRDAHHRPVRRRARPRSSCAGLGMSDRAQAMLFEAFARSFFAQPGALSAARADRDVPLLLPRQPRGHRLRRPGHRLPDLHLGARSRPTWTSTARRCAPRPRPGALAPAEGHRWRVGTDDGRADHAPRRAGHRARARCATCSPPPPPPRTPHPGSPRRPRRSRWRRRSP